MIKITSKKGHANRFYYLKRVAKKGFRYLKFEDHFAF